MIIKLGDQHRQMVIDFFDDMGLSPYYFIETYLSDLKKFHAYASAENGKISCIVPFYESIDDASWYISKIYNNGSMEILHNTMDVVIEHNEKHGRLKFYSLLPMRKNNQVYRRFLFGETNSQRYDYFDEFYVAEKHQCMFTLPWVVLFNRILLPTDHVVRCSFLKQEYRTELYNAGKL